MENQSVILPKCRKKKKRNGGYEKVKILIINTQSVNHSNATGVTLRSILREKPSEEILELYMQPCVRAADALPIRSVQLGFWECPVRTLANRFNRAGTETSVSVENPGKSSFKKRMKSRLIMTIDFEKVFLTKKIRRLVNEFAPDCVYTLGNSIDAMKYACKLADYCGVHILPHFMDNWQESHRYGSEKYPTHCKTTQKWLKQMYEKAVCGLTISEKMAAVYEERWRIRHFALMNAVDVGQYYCGQKKENERILVYAGGLHLNRYKSLLEIARCVDRLNRGMKSSSDEGYKLEIYTDSKSKALYEGQFAPFQCVSFREYVKHDQIRTVYERASILVHIETFDPEYRNFILYSLSTKISEYLATGLPILLYAPEEIFVSEYLKCNNAAAVVSDEETLSEALKKLMSDPSYRAELGSKAEKLAREKHDKAIALMVFDQAVDCACK